MVMHYIHEFYFESAAMILTLITVGKMLEARSKGKTTDALKGLMKLAPKTAVIERKCQEVTVPIEQVKKGYIFIVRPGENVPVDGVIIEGSSALNEAALTGESIPVDKKAGDAVSAATLNQSGFSAVINRFYTCLNASDTCFYLKTIFSQKFRHGFAGFKLMKTVFRMMPEII